MKKHYSVGLSAFALAALLSGCAGSTATPTSPSAATTPSGGSAASPVPVSASAPAASTPDLKVTDSTAGRIVVDGKGRSVYYYTKDVKDSGTSTCTGGCIAAWPPVLATTDAPAVDGVAGTVGTIATPEGKKQLTINGMPVYYYAKDLAAGDIRGQGVGSVWYLVAPSGDMITGTAGQ